MTTNLPIGSYQQEQLDTLSMVLKHLNVQRSVEISALREKIEDYVAFRQEMHTFLDMHFKNLCTTKCYQSQLSACCSKEGIITFFADVVVNVLVSSEKEIKHLLQILQKPNNGNKCIYLGAKGCLWQIKPIVCERFLCDAAANEVFDSNPIAKNTWLRLKQQEKRFTWPDRPILFDDLEACFLKANLSSSLMYMHNSPGLLRIKQQSNSRSV